MSVTNLLFFDIIFVTHTLTVQKFDWNDVRMLNQRRQDWRVSIELLLTAVLHVTCDRADNRSWQHYFSMSRTDEREGQYKVKLSVTLSLSLSTAKKTLWSQDMDPTTVVDGIWLIFSETRHQESGHSTRTTSFGSSWPENSWTSGAPWWDPALGRYTVDVVAVDRLFFSKSKLHRLSCQAFNRWTLCRANEERLWRCLCRCLITKSKYPRQWMTKWRVTSETSWVNILISGSHVDLLMSDRCNTLHWPRRSVPRNIRALSGTDSFWRWSNKFDLIVWSMPRWWFVLFDFHSRQDCSKVLSIVISSSWTCSDKFSWPRQD